MVHVGVCVIVGVKVRVGVRVGGPVRVGVPLTVRVGGTVVEFVGDGVTVGVGEMAGTSSGISFTRSAAVARASPLTSTPPQLLFPKMPSTTAGRSAVLTRPSQFASPRMAALAATNEPDANSDAASKPPDTRRKSRRSVVGTMRKPSAQL
jgi:hypothetical protein